MSAMTTPMRCAVLAVVASASLADAQTVEEFYRGKTIRVIVGSSAGGIYSSYARLMQRHLADFIPGKPTIIVQIMEGAGGNVAANFVYNAAPQDGTVIVGMQRGQPAEEALGVQGPQFASDKFQWLGSLNQETSVIAVMSRVGVSTVADLRRKEVLMGSSGPDATYYPALMNNVMGTKFRVIEGYTSMPVVNLAMARGELDGGSQSFLGFEQTSAAWIVDGTAKYIVQIGFTRHPRLPDVPLIAELASRENLLPGYDYDEVQRLLRVQMTDVPMGRPYALGPRVPADRVAALRAAFDAMTKSEAFRADAARLNIEARPSTGEELQAIARELKAMPKASLAKLGEMIKYNGARESVQQ